MLDHLVQASVTAPQPVGADVLAARAYLLRAATAPAPALYRFVARVGPVDAAERVARRDVPADVAAETIRAPHVVPAHPVVPTGARLLIPEHAEAWPHRRFAELAATGAPDLTPPLALWLRGPIEAFSQRCAAVLGTTIATKYGSQLAGEFGAGLAERGATVVSTAKLGIDGAAQRGVLAVGGPTIAVLASGVDRAYPAANQSLIEHITATGLLVSEYPPGAVPARHKMVARQRLIAALSDAVLVVESRIRSSALHTARLAASLGRPVLAVPGPITSGVSAGCHLLIQGGARLAVDADDVLEALFAPTGGRSA